MHPVHPARRGACHTLEPLTALADVIRSKNAGPYEITLDIIFASAEVYRIVKKHRLIRSQTIADLYGLTTADIRSVVYFDPAAAVKITMTRAIVSGAPGDTDVYGAQQHAPLLGLKLDVGCKEDEGD